MKKTGFAFIETIITIVILSASLLYLYNSYDAIISDEEMRLYYDDVAHIYETNYIRKFLDEYTNIDMVKKTAFTNTYSVVIGTDYETLFTDSQKEYIKSLSGIILNYRVNQMILIDTKMFDNCFNDEDEKCKNSFVNMSYNLKNYVNTLNDTSYDYYLVVEYAETSNGHSGMEKCAPGIDRNCVSYYASLGI